MKIFKRILVFIIAAAVIGGVAALIVISTKIHYNPEGTVGNTSGNLMNGGLFAEHDGIIYFANPYDKNHLYSMNSDCTNVKQLSHDTVSHINVCDNYIFYVRNNFDAENAAMVFRGQLYGLVRMTLNGKRQKTLTTDIVSAMLLYGNELIYSCYKDNHINTKAITIDKKTERIVNNNEFPIYSISGGNIFYSNNSDNHEVYTLNSSFGYTTPYHAGNTYLASMVDGYLYYIDLGNNYALTKYNPVTDTTLVLYDESRCINYNVYNDVVFFQTESKAENALHRMSTNGANDVIITTGNTVSINCTSQYTFFFYFGQDILYRVPTHGSSRPEPITITMPKK